MCLWIRSSLEPYSDTKSNGWHWQLAVILLCASGVKPAEAQCKAKRQEYVQSNCMTSDWLNTFAQALKVGFSWHATLSQRCWRRPPQDVSSWSPWHKQGKTERVWSNSWMQVRWVPEHATAGRLCVNNTVEMWICTNKRSDTLWCETMWQTWCTQTETYLGQTTQRHPKKTHAHRRTHKPTHTHAHNHAHTHTHTLSDVYTFSHSLAHNLLRHVHTHFLSFSF